MRTAPKFDRRTVTKNIEAIIKLEGDDERRLSALHRVSHKIGWFVGTIYFVRFEVAFVVLWITWNASADRSFDRYPFPLLSAVLALEAVLLTSFVLIRQNSMDLQSERRNHLDLQINLLAEQEATSILKALQEIATRFNIDLSHDPETRELTQDTPVENIARDLRSKEDQVRHKPELPAFSAIQASFCQEQIDRFLACWRTISLNEENPVQIRAGYDIAFQCFQETPMTLMLSVHPSRSHDLLGRHNIQLSNDVHGRDFLDMFGNTCTRSVAPPGLLVIKNDFLIADSGLPDAVVPNARQIPISELPDEVLVYLLGSRYCDTQKLSDLAWSLFGGIAPGWQRVQAICDYTHAHISFGYHHARCDRTASEGHHEGVGVCRDFAHLAIALCRCMNIPARYCTGYLGDVGVPIDPAPMDFSAWFEVHLDGTWFTFDARHNHPRIGRIVIARGRDAADVAISTSFGATQLAKFTVITEEVANRRSMEQTARAA